ncbi:hypothetical protein CQA66_04915 [Helicobacter aurati]|uniref:Uncharacterized protein n=1 Tax=Helicobacter aurati TaxID=137778 RepID=A0A3D8J5I1_9HELI|nr:hypothetical protein [Helicobacter aurati]RDU72405.1 hypothetical protein CQA66_04915 [Helicobacter aurati]
MQYIYQIYYIITTLCLGVILASCAGIGQFGNSEEQLQAVKQRLEDYTLSELREACDGCNFLMQEAISTQSNTVSPDHSKLSRAKSGVRVYVFQDVSIEDALVMLLDSNIFARRINKNYKDALMEIIQNGGSDFNQNDNESQMDYKAFSSLTFAKRLKSRPSEPKAQLDSVETIDTNSGGWRYSDSLEAFIVDKEIIIIHYYSQNEIWLR